MSQEFKILNKKNANIFMSVFTMVCVAIMFAEFLFDITPVDFFDLAISQSIAITVLFALAIIIKKGLGRQNLILLDRILYDSLMSFQKWVNRVLSGVER